MRMKKTRGVPGAPNQATLKHLDRQVNRRSSDGGAQLEAVLAASRRIHAAMDGIDAHMSTELEVSRSDLRCLNLLEFGALTAGELARRLNLTTGSVTAMVDRLERIGFVERRRSVSDRRSVEVQIPAAAFPRIAALYRTVGAAVRTQFAGIEASTLDASIAALETFATALEGSLGTLRRSTPTSPG